MAEELKTIPYSVRLVRTQICEVVVPATTPNEAARKAFQIDASKPNWNTADISIEGVYHEENGIIHRDMLTDGP